MIKERDFRLSLHAEDELLRRSIPKEFLESVLFQPQQVVEEEGGRLAYQSQLPFANGKIYLVRAIVEETEGPPVVITVYRTSKILKYWRLS